MKKIGENIKAKLYPRIFFSLLFLSILFLAYSITKPFLPALLTGAIIAYLSYPFYEKVTRYVTNKNLASFIVAICIVLLVAVPSVFVTGLVTREAISTYNSLNQTTLNDHNLGTNFLKVVCREEAWLSCKFTNILVGFLPHKDLDYYLKISIEKITTFVIDNFEKLLVSIPSAILNFFVMIFVVYYLLKDGEIVAKRIKNILPLKDSHKRHVLERFHETTSAVFYGNIAVALIQGIVGIMGFIALGVPSPILWGFVMTLFALIPYFGTAIIWLPAALNLIFIGYLQNDTSFTIRGVVLIVYGITVISTIDNILKPKLIGTKARVHPILVLLGILGGINLFGLIGIILGPVMLALLVTFVDIYEEEKSELEKYF